MSKQKKIVAFLPMEELLSPLFQGHTLIPPSPPQWSNSGGHVVIIKLHHITGWNLDTMLTTPCVPHETCHMSCDTCHMSHVRCHISGVTYQVSHVTSNSKVVKAMEQQFREKVLLIPPVNCHLSCIMCHKSCVIFHVSCVTYHIFFFASSFLDNLVKLVCGGYIIKGA